MGNRRTLHKLLDQGTTPPPPPLTIVSVTTQTGTNSLIHNLTGVPAGALLVVSATSQDAQVDGIVSSSPSLTWTKRVDATIFQSPTAEIWTAVFTAGGSIDVTTNYGAGRVQTSVVYVITGQEATLNGAFATGLGQTTSNVDIITTRTNSIVITTTSNWNMTTALTYRTPPNPVEVLEHIDPLNGTFAHFYYIAPTVGTYTVGYSDPVDGDNGTSTAVLEIRGGGTIGNQAPIANAGANQTITLPTSSVNLSGSLSSDDVAITAYLWTRISGPNTPTITTPNNVNTSVTGLIAGVYVFRLQVTDGGGLSNTDDVQITVNAVANQAPVANAGANQNITLPTSSVTLDSSASTDDVGITSRTWTRQSGPNTPTIVTPNGITTNVTGLIAGIYVFRITVFDAGALSSFDEVQITVNNPVNSPPSAPVLTSPAHGTFSVDLAWSAATDDVGVSNYRVYRNGGLIDTVSTSTLTYTASSLSPSTTYSFRVEAVDGGGLFTPSNTINVTTNPDIPLTPFTFTAITQDYRRYWGGPEFWGGGSGAMNLSNWWFNGNTAYPNVHAHRYRRFTWNDLEGGSNDDVPYMSNTINSYRFTNTSDNGLKGFLDQCISQKILASFGIMSCFPFQEEGDSFHNYVSYSGVGSSGQGSSYPQYLHNMMQAEPATRDWDNGNIWVPNFNSPSYHSRWGALMVALNNFLNTTVPGQTFRYWDVIGYIDLRGMGAYGEWHSHGITLDNPISDIFQYPGFTWNIVGGNKNIVTYGAFPTPASLITIIDHQRNNLGGAPLCTILNSLDGNFPNGGTGTYSGYFGTGFINTGIPVSVGQYLMNNNNAWGPIGRRRDQWGDMNNYYRVVSEEEGAVPGTTTRWLTAPIMGEPPGYVARDSRGIHMGALDPNGNSNPGEQEVVRQHASIIGNSNYGNGGNINIDTFEGGIGQAPMQRAFTRMGCILRLVTGGGIDLSIPGSMKITTLWRNFGVAPQYKKNWAVTFELRSGAALVWSGVSTLNLYTNSGLKQDTGANVTIEDTFTRPALTGNFQLSVRILDPANYLEPLQLGIQGRQTNGSYVLTNITL